MRYILMAVILSLTATARAETNGVPAFNTNTNWNTSLLGNSNGTFYSSYTTSVYGGFAPMYLINTNPATTALIKLDQDTNNLYTVELLGYVLTNYINKAAADGTICQVLGHKWYPFFDPTWNQYGSSDKRRCLVCAKVETMIKVWK